jgi:hypothetical protein
MRVFRHEPPSELDKGARADDARWAFATPGLDPAFAASVKNVRELDNLSGRLSDGRWAPSTPAEIAAALQTLAEGLDCVWDVERNSDPSMHTLREHVLALESLIAGREVAFLANLDEDDEDTSLAERVEFQRLYRHFEEQCRAGKDAGLHQRISDVEGRLALLEARLDDDPNWFPDPDDLAQGFLWLRGRCDGGPHIGHRSPGDPDPAVGLPLADLASTALRPKTWAQLLDCLQMLAQDVEVLVDDADREPDDLGSPLPLPPASDEDKERLATVLAAARPRPAEKGGLLAQLREAQETHKQLAQKIEELGGLIDQLPSNASEPVPA